jgi:hypothetical protein
MAGSVVLLAMFGVLAGCKSTDLAKDGSLASIVINGYSKAEIQQAAVDVFKSDHFYQVDDSTFEKKGSANDTFMFGGLDMEQVWIRVRMHIAPGGKDRHVLGCDAYVVQNHGDRFIETETRFKYSKGEECLNILNQIQQQLVQPAQNQPEADNVK